MATWVRQTGPGFGHSLLCQVAARSPLGRHCLGSDCRAATAQRGHRLLLCPRCHDLLISSLVDTLLPFPEIPMESTWEGVVHRPLQVQYSEHTWHMGVLVALKE